MRNFWAIIDCDGVQPVGRGPRSDDGQMSISVRHNEKGYSVEKVSIFCRKVDDKLITTVSIPGHDDIHVESEDK